MYFLPFRTCPNLTLTGLGQGGALAGNGGPVETILILEGGMVHNLQNAVASADGFDLDGDESFAKRMFGSQLDR